MFTAEKKKFVWDEKMTEMYIKVAIEEVKVGNRPTTHLNKKGWANLQQNFNTLTKKYVDIKQLKNKWNNLKKDWQIWKLLLGNETNLGWNVEKKTIEASDDWWEAKLKEIPAGVKFRDKGLSLPNEMDLLFGDVVPSGQEPWTPSLGILPRIEMIDMVHEGVGDNDDSPPIEQAIDENVELSDGKGKGKRLQTSSYTPKAKKRTLALNVHASLERLSGVVETVQKNVDTAIEGCLEVLDSLNVKDDPDFYYECLYLLSKEKDVREFLLCLKEPEIQLGFLKKAVIERNK